MVSLQALEVEPAALAELRTAVQDALDSREQAVAAVSYSLGKIVTAGLCLLKHRGEQEHGAWYKWLEQNVPQITPETARKWMKLAEFVQLKGNIENASTVRQAYVLAGILPENDSTPPKGGKGSPSLVLSVAKARSHIAGEITAKPLDQWNRKDLALLEEELRKFTELWEQVSQFIHGHPL